MARYIIQRWFKLLTQFKVEKRDGSHLRMSSVTNFMLEGANHNLIYDKRLHSDVWLRLTI